MKVLFFPFESKRERERGREETREIRRVRGSESKRGRGREGEEKGERER